MKDTIVNINWAEVASVVALLATTLSGLRAIRAAHRQSIIDTQQILQALCLLEQRLDHIESRLDRNDNFIAANSGLRGWRDQ